MELLGDLLKMVLPAAFILYAVFLTVQSFLNKEFREKQLELKREGAEQILTSRLQAYERMCLLLERSQLTSLIPRVNQGEMNKAQLQFLLIKEIRDELGHNLSQQLYISDKAWGMTVTALESLVQLINEAASKVEDEQPALMLVQVLLAESLNKEGDTINTALAFIKEEARSLFIYQANEQSLFEKKNQKKG
ncbi:MAG: hypothetical protein MI784_15810 [Cytophagales bacterium]|nr:hypothetical protein [Cytophagales bacterium]